MVEWLIFIGVLIPVGFGVLAILEGILNATGIRKGTLFNNREWHEEQRRPPPPPPRPRDAALVRLGDELALAQETIASIESPSDGSRPSGRTLLRLLTWEDLEAITAEVLEAEDWKCELTGPGADRGVDVRGARTDAVGRRAIVVQVKHFRDGTVGRPVALQLIGAAATEGATDALLVTSGRFSKSASELLDEWSGDIRLDYWGESMLASRIDALPRERLADFVNAREARLLAAARALVREQERAKEAHQSDLERVWPCPVCSMRMIRRHGRRGTFWGCPQFPRCHGLRDLAGADKTRER